MLARIVSPKKPINVARIHQWHRKCDQTTIQFGSEMKKQKQTPKMNEWYPPPYPRQKMPCITHCQYQNTGLRCWMCPFINYNPIMICMPNTACIQREATC
jgi:hypothetical protein